MAVVRVLELKAATSWCQNFPAEGHFRDSISRSAIGDGGSHRFKKSIHLSFGPPANREFQKRSFPGLKTGTPRHNSESSGVQKR